LILAEISCHNSPFEHKFQTTLGLAQYRVGDYPAAIATITRVDPVSASGRAGSSPAELACLAMAQFQLGRHDEARTTLSRLRVAAQQAPWKDDPDDQAFLREAESLVRREPAK
jgi:hypothetical protein